MSSWSSLTGGNAFKSPAFIALVSALCVAVVLLLHHFIRVACCPGGGGGGDRRNHRHHHHHRRIVATTSSADARRQQQQQAEADDDNDDDEESVSVEVSTTSRTHLVSAEVVVCRYRKEEAWNESTCPVCLADFADGEAVRVLPECLHYFHAECIDTWLRGGSTSCPLCRAETTPTPTPSPASTVRHHLELEVSVSLEEILVRT